MYPLILFVTYVACVTIIPSPTVPSTSWAVIFKCYHLHLSMFLCILYFLCTMQASFWPKSWLEIVNRNHPLKQTVEMSGNIHARASVAWSIFCHLLHLQFMSWLIWDNYLGRIWDMSSAYIYRHCKKVLVVPLTDSPTVHVLKLLQSVPLCLIHICLEFPCEEMIGCCK